MRVLYESRDKTVLSRLGRAVAWRMPPEDAAFDAWVKLQDDAITRDAVWRVLAYRLGSFVQECSWPDVQRLARTAGTRRIADQLYYAIGSVPANIAEGYGRSSKRDRCRFYEYALSEARESVVWYRAAAPVIGRAATQAQQARLQRIVRLLLTMIATDRGLG